MLSKHCWQLLKRKNSKIINFNITENNTFVINKVFKYSGIIFDINLNFRNQIDHQSNEQRKKDLVPN